VKRAERDSRQETLQAFERQNLTRKEWRAAMIEKGWTAE